MTLLYPEVLWLFFALAFFLAVAAIGYRRGRELLRRLAGGWRIEQSVRAYFIKTLVEWFTLGLFISFSILALAGISWSKKSVKDETVGLDLIFAVDVSRSMTAADIQPNRLGLGSELIHSLIPAAERTGIVIFKGEGEVLVPLTEDRVAVESAVNNLSPALYTVPGSNVAKGLERALEAFPEGSPARKAVVLISDGESLEGNPADAAREFQLRNITLYTVAAGTDKGSMIYDADGEPLLDENGGAVVTRLDREAMQSIADGGGGELYDLGDPRSSGRILQDIQSLREGPAAQGIRFDNQSNYRFFLLVALISLVLNLFTSQLRWSKWY